MPHPTTNRRVRLLTPAAIGVTNRTRVLEFLHQQGPSSRAQIARALNVNRATIATILQPLIDQGTLVEGDSVAASPAGGKPARPLWFRGDGLELGAMRIAPNMITAARLGMDGEVHAWQEIAMELDAPLDTITSVIMEAAHACFDGAQLLGVGVAASGMVDVDAGEIISLHLAPSLTHYPLGPTLSQAFSVPVAVDHHPRVQALGDKWFGQGRALTHFASVYTGEALGFGIVHDGAIVRGDGGAGGESGHTVVDLNGEPCLCGRTGCWETVATLGWLRRECGRRGLAGATEMDCARLTALVDGGDQVARELRDLYARNVAIGMANNEQILASGTYIMHGDVCAGGEPMRAEMERHLRAFSPHRGDPPVVLLADEPDRMTLLGGGGLVLSRSLGTIS